MDSPKWRSGVCARKPDEAVFAVSTALVNFHEFARLFRDKLGCRNALYLDGTLPQVYVAATKPYARMFAVFVLVSK